MRHLKQILASIGIRNKLDFSSHIQNLTSCAAAHTPLELLTRDALKLDDEDRLYDNAVDFKEKILDVARLQIQNSTQIYIRDCIICGDLHMTQNERSSTKIVLDYCIVLGKIVIYGLDHPEDSVEITLTNANEFCFNNLRIPSVSISHCHAVRVSISESNIQSLYTFGNLIEFIDVRGSIVSSSQFDFRQVLLENLSVERIESSVGEAKKNFNPFDFTFNRGMTDGTQADRSNRETLLFLLDKTNIRSSRPDRIRLDHLLNLTGQKRGISRKAIDLLGSFLWPGRIAVTGLIGYLVFAVAYYAVPGMRFTLNGHSIGGIGILEAMYFSGITFTTIGYGDLSPLGLARFLAVIEGLFGLLTGSAFLVSLVRGYCD